MSNIPITNIQYSQPDFSIYHQNVVASNVQGTAFVEGFPTAPTGTSLGMYQHLGIDGEANKKTDFLNVSGTSTGGYNFWTSNVSNAPILLADITTDGISIVKRTSQSYEPFGTFGSGSNYVILDHPPVGPPTNWVLGNMYIVQVGNSNTFLFTGVNYNVNYVDTQVITFHTTSDPNSPVIDSTGITSILIPYGGAPAISASTTLNDDLVLTDNVATSTLNKSSLTLSTTASGAFTQITNSSLKSQNNTNNYASTLDYNGVSVRDLANSIGTLVANNRVLVNSDITGYGGTLTDSYVTINNGANISQLTATNLTFNGPSIVSSIRNLQIKQLTPLNQYISAAIYADGKPPLTPSTTIAQQYAYTPSWYFKNTFPTNNKINWYILANPGMIVSDILGLYLAFFNGNNTSNDNTPFITVYTTPGTGTGPDYAPGFFHSAKTYIFNGSITANTRYTEFLNLDNCPTPNYYGTTLRSMISSPVSPNPRGQYLPTETVEFFSIGSNSAATINTLEFAVSKFGIMLSSGTTEVNFFA